MTPWLAACLIGPACDRTEAPPQPPPPTSAVEVPVRTPTGLMIGDRLEVRVYGEDKLTGLYQVNEDGTIDFPLVGTVPVLGASPGEVAADLETRLRDGYLRDPQVTVLVDARQNLEVSVLGEVAEPGRMPFVDNLTLVQAVSAAGGLTEYAASRRVRVTRKGPDGPETFEVSLREITEGRREDIVLRAGDIVFVPQSPI